MTASPALGFPECCLNPAASSYTSTSSNTESASGRWVTPSTKAILFSLGLLLLGSLGQSPLHGQTAYFSGAVTSLGGGLNQPEGVAVDQSGNIYVADTANNAVKEMPAGCASTSCVTTLGGNFNAPKGVAVDASGNVYVADSLNDEVKEMSPGCTPAVYSSAGCTINALGGGFSEPFGVAVDKNGNVYVADTGTGLVKEMTPDCTSYLCVTTLGEAGGAPIGVAVDSSGNVYVGDLSLGLYEMPPGCTETNFQAQMCTATKLGGGLLGQGVAVDRSGNVYFANSDGSAVNEMPPGCTSASCVTTLGGGFGAPSGIAVDLSGNVYVGIQSRAAVQEILQHGVNFGAVPVGSTGPALTLYFTFTARDSGITASAVTQGIKGLDFVDDGTGTCDTNGTGYTYVAYPPGSYDSSYTCSVNVTFGPKYAGARYGAVQLSDATGVIATAYIYGTGQGPEIAFDPGTIGTVAGNGTLGYSGDGGAATSAELNGPGGVALDGAGNVYIADTGNSRIREVNASTGIITTVAGNGTLGYSGDGGAATSAELHGLIGVTLDGAGNVYIADSGNHRIREVNASTGFITTVAGNGTAGYGGDGGVATSAELNAPCGVAVDGAGNFYIADSNNNRIREVNASSGIITTVAGNGTAGYSGDGGAATSAELHDPDGVALDGAGNVYIADNVNQRVREVIASTGIIATVAGNGISGYGGDGGPATSATLTSPTDIAVDGGGNIYIAGFSNNGIREVNASTGIITAVAGNGTVGYSGDGGPATSAELWYPFGVALNGAGSLYIADTDNMRIREVNVSAPSMSYASTNVGSQSADSPKTVTLQNIGNTPLTFPVPGTGENPSVSANFTLDSATTCPEVLTSSSAGTLAAGATCALALDFIPTTTGTINGSAVLTDNNRNAANAMQTIGLSGTGIGQTTPTITWANPAAITYGTPLSSTQLDATASVSGTFVYSPPVGTLLNAGMQTLSVTFTPNDTTDYTTASASVMLQVNMAPQTITFAPLPATQQGGTLPLSATGGLSGNPVIFTSLTPGVCSVLNATATLSSPGTCTIQANQAGNANYAAAIPVSQSVINTAALSFGTVPVGTTSATQTITFSPPGGSSLASISVVTQGAANLDFANAGGGTCNPSLARFASGTTCTVNVTFTPKYAGVRYGAVVLTDGSGNVLAASYVSGIGQGPQLVFDPGTIATIAGNGTMGYSGDGGAAISADLQYPSSVAMDGAGNLYIADGNNHRIREVNASTGIITTVAGNGTPGYSGDGGAATSAELYFPEGVAVDSAGNLYIADRDNLRIREVSASTGIITTVAGNGSPGSSGDGGSATSANLNYPFGVGVDSAGNVYIADSANNRVREVNGSTGVITTVAGNGNAGSSGDNGAAASAELYNPTGVVVDSAGNIYIADTSNNRIREVNASNGIITTLAGNGTAGYGGDAGPATSAELAYPYGVAVDGAGNVYVADYFNSRIREVNTSTGTIITVAGSGTAGYNGDGGPATGAELKYPYGVVLDGAGNLYIADTYNQRIREVNVSAASLSFASTNVGSQSADSPQTVTLQNIGNAPLTFPVPGTGENPSISANFTLDSSTTCPEVLTSSSPGALAAGATCALALDFVPTTTGAINGTAVLTDNNLNISTATQTINLSGTGLISTVGVSIGTNPAGLSFSINGTSYSTTQTPSLNIGTQYALNTTSPQAGGPGVQYVFSQWSDGTTSLTDLLTPITSTTSDLAQFTSQYMLTVTAGSGGTIGASTAPNGFYNPGTLQSISATPNAGYYFAGWTGANSPGDLASATSTTTTVTMNGPENLTANFAPIPTFQVTTLNDDATGNPANCTTPSPNCSLRDAITAIEANNGSTGNITFASGLNGTMTLTSALPALSGQITITGTGAGNITISGGNAVQVFQINSGTVSISGLTIANGNTSSQGGGIFNNGALTVSNSVFSGNSASPSACCGQGGAIYNSYPGAVVTVSNSTFSGNSAYQGGGIFSYGANLTVTNSTFYGNTARTFGAGIMSGTTATVSGSTFFGNSAEIYSDSLGGGIFVGSLYGGAGTLTLSNSTLSGNSAHFGGLIFGGAGTLTITNSIVAGNTTTNQPGDDCDGCSSPGPGGGAGGGTLNYNLISTPINVIDPVLAPLGNYGGPTQTMLPLPGSAAICGASSALIPAGITTDQRGFSNSTTYNSTQCYDLGAVQTNYSLSFSATQEPPSTGTLPTLPMSPAPVVTVTESGNPLTAGSASVNLTDTNSDLTTSPATATTSASNGQATFGTLIFTGPTSGDTLAATLALNSNLAGLNLTATSTNFSVAAGTPAVLWPTASAITFGQTLASSTLSGGSASFNNTSVSGSFAFTNPSTAPGAGVQTENVIFTPSNTSAYNSVNGTVSVPVNKATPTVTFTGAPVTAPYGGTFAVTATTNASTTAVITASGSCSIAGAIVTITLPSGTCSLTAAWATDNNYLAASALQTTTATKATPVITWGAPAAITYGTALSGTQLDATATYNGANVAGKFVYTPAKGTVLTAGMQTLSVTFTPTNTTNFATPPSASVTLQVNRATPKITWARPAAITYGTALSSTQLDATASVPGSFVYAPAAGTILGAGTQTLSVTFTPTDAVDYTTAGDSVSLSVNKATPVVTWPTPALIVYGTPLGSTQLDATASVPGTFAYSPAAGKIEPAGSDKLSVTFTPTDNVDYATVTASVTLQVGLATPTINWAPPTAMTYGTALSTKQLNATATNNGVTVAGTFVYTPAKGTVLGAGSQTLSVKFTPTNTTDFTSASASVTLQVNPATPKITWAKPAAITYGTALSSNQLDATASVPGTLIYSPPAGTVISGGTQTLSVTFSPTNSVDYTSAADSVSIIVYQSTSTTTITANTPDPAAVDQPVSVGFTVDGANGIPTGTVSVTASTGQSCTGALSGGNGSCALTFTATGSPKLTAVYSGDNNFKTSTSAKVTETVN